VQKRFPTLKLTFENENMHKVGCKIQNLALAFNNYCNLVDISIQLAYYWVNIVLNYLYHAKPAQNLFIVILCINQGGLNFSPERSRRQQSAPPQLYYGAGT